MKRLKDIYIEDRPREKLLKRGIVSLKNEELLALILGSGSKNKDVMKLSKEIVNILQKRREEISIEDLVSIDGMGVAKASQILASIELTKRLLYKKRSIAITSAKQVYQQLQEFIYKKQEHFIVLTLDGASYIINKSIVFIGSLNQSLVHPREVFAQAISDRAASIIISHNHPSGQLSPSIADLEVTKRLKKVGEIMGIELLDHVIISHNGYFSLQEEGLM